METKKKYVPPKIELTIIELEYSLAAGSAELKIGGETGNGVPKVEDWVEKKDDKFWDF